MLLMLGLGLESCDLAKQRVRQPSAVGIKCFALAHVKQPLH